MDWTNRKPRVFEDERWLETHTGVSARFISKIAKSGGIPYLMVGKKRLYHYEDTVALLRGLAVAQTATPKEPANGE